MDEALEYIEAYFQKSLGQAEMRQFEQRCEQDPSFAQQVAFYITSREAARQLLVEQKQQDWASLTQAREMAPEPAPVRKLGVRRWLPYAAAACVLLFVGLFFAYNSQSLNRQVAGDVRQELGKLSTTMSPATDSLETGKRLYNEGKYREALKVFASIIQSDSTKEDALLFAGYVHLRLKEYDKALDYFRELSGRKLESNRGPYLMALTLLERNQQGDREQARDLLRGVVAARQAGSDEARKLLDALE